MKLNTHQKRLARVLLGAAVYAFGALYKPEREIASLLIFLVAFAIVGGDVLWKAIRNILRGEVFDENFLMSIATVGAFAIGQYEEGAAVMLFYQVGELFQSYAVDRSRKSIAELMDIRPDSANVLREGNLLAVDPDEVAVGEIIVIRPGEKVPLDAVVTEGFSAIDTSMLTGESLPREVAPGDALLSGTINKSGLLSARVQREFGESTASKILDLVENAAVKKASSENFITKFARYYTPAVVLVALLLAVVPPLFVPGALFRDWLYRALVFLVVSCPCALVISIPLSFFGGIGGASRNGILVKGGNHLEDLAKTEIVVFDKTGTLTKGAFAVQGIYPEGIGEEALLEMAAHAESHSSHPISQSLTAAYGRAVDPARISFVEEIPGHGVIATVDGKSVAAGNAKLMHRLGIALDEVREIPGTLVYIAIDGIYRGHIAIADQIRADAPAAIRGLKALGVEKTAMLTGDTRAIGEAVAKELGIDSVYAELLPGEKVERMEMLLAEKSPRGKLAFVGDGINDAPVLARADIGIAMGGLGSDAAIEAADVVIMTDEPSKLLTAVRLSRKTLSIVRQNIVLALGVKGAVLLLGAAGAASMWAAVFADVGVAVLAILNAVRALKIEK